MDPRVSQGSGRYSGRWIEDQSLVLEQEQWLVDSILGVRLKRLKFSMPLGPNITKYNMNV